MSGDIEAAARKIFEQLPDIDGDEADWLFYREALCAGARNSFAALVAERDALRKALDRSRIAIDDWLHLYAGELCDEADVKESERRVGEYGTLWYIATVQEQNRAALSPAAHKGGV